MPEHNYIRKVIEFADRNQIPKDRLSEIGIYHDNNCGIFIGLHCDCDPDVRLIDVHPAPADGPKGPRKP